MEHDGDCDTYKNWRGWNDSQKLGKKIQAELEIKGIIETIKVTASLRSYRIL